VGLREAAIWSGVWVTLAAAFNLAIYFWFGPERALEFTTGYLIEKALAVDNIFVIAVILSFFAVPAAYQHRVLYWGILGALVMRAAFVLGGSALLQQFHWAIYVLGGFLAVTGVKLLLQRTQEFNPGRNPLVRLLRRILPVTDGHRGDRFTVVEGGRRYATPLFLALLTVEAADLVFAVDSIPAIFAITSDPFIVFTSNIFAILGLRAMYFLLVGVMDRFHYLKAGLALVLVFVGVKMVAAAVVKIPVALSLGIVALILGGAVIASLLRPRPALDPHGSGSRSTAARTSSSSSAAAGSSAGQTGAS
jgi:tellurite resistance protein TerC